MNQTGQDGRAIISTTGTLAEVARFFRVSVRTVQNWKSARPPLLSFWQEGANICFGEEAVVALRVRFMRLSERVEPGEAERVARAEWREHLGVRSAECGMRSAELERRLARLEEAVFRAPDNENAQELLREHFKCGSRNAERGTESEAA